MMIGFITCWVKEMYLCNEMIGNHEKNAVQIGINLIPVL